MDLHRIHRVRIECARFQRTLDELEDRWKHPRLTDLDREGSLRRGTPESGAARRASMDLTRELVRFRRP